MLCFAFISVSAMLSWTSLNSRLLKTFNNCFSCMIKDADLYFWSGIKHALGSWRDTSSLLLIFDSSVAMELGQSWSLNQWWVCSGKKCFPFYFFSLHEIQMKISLWKLAAVLEALPTGTSKSVRSKLAVCFGSVKPLITECASSPFGLLSRQTLLFTHP